MLTLLLAGTMSSPAQFEERPKLSASAPTNTPIREISPGIFELGRVTLNKKERTVTFPALLNLAEGVIEYLVVTESGKIHESLLRTGAEPYHINLALLLLGAKGAGTNAIPETNAPATPGDRVSLELSWLSLEKEIRRPAEQLVQNRLLKAPMIKGPWAYTGSHVIEGTFLAQQEGSIVAVMIDPTAIINNPRRGAENDEAWQVNTNGLPPLNWPVQVTIRLGTKP